MMVAMQILYLLTAALIAGGLVLSLIAEKIRTSQLLGSALVIGAMATASLYVILRWATIGHPPIFGTFENTFAATWFMLAFAAAMLRVRGLRQVWRVAFPSAVLLLLWGSRYRAQPVPLTISELSMWVDVHALFAWVAFVPLLVLGSLSAIRLITKGKELEEMSPSLAQVQTIVSVAFVSMTAMLLTGAWYLNVLFGTFWQWGVVETISLIVWLLYGMVLHGILFRRWSPTWLAWSCLLIVPVLIAAYFVWSVFPGTFHYFDVPLVKPY